MNTVFTNYDQLPLALSAEEVAQVLGISQAGAYTLMHSEGFPVLNVERRMVVPKTKFLEWLEKQVVA
jgi:predicted DNA-binding transcriptional regulator AlpA